MRQLKKSRRFSRVLAEHLKNGSNDFHQPYVIFGQSSIEVFKIKILKTDHRCHGNQFMRECWAKNHDLREKSGIVFRFRTDTAFLS